MINQQLQKYNGNWQKEKDRKGKYLRFASSASVSRRTGCTSDEIIVIQNTCRTESKIDRKLLKITAYRTQLQEIIRITVIFQINFKFVYSL